MITQQFREEYALRIKNIKRKIPAALRKPYMVIQTGSSGHTSILKKLSTFFEKSSTVKFSVYTYDALGLPTPIVPGHLGTLDIYQIKIGKKVRVIWIFCGRHHFYENGDVYEATLMMRVALSCGAKNFILLNAAGGLGDRVNTGDVMFITDCDTNIPSPNIGILHNGDQRFTNCSKLFDKAWYEASGVYGKNDFKVGAYFARTGPEYESPIVAKSLLKLGYDAVGMSTVPEVLAIKAFNPNARIAAVSLITNHHFKESTATLSHEEVKMVAKENEQKVAEAVMMLIKGMK